jgi:hypothetical protein
MGLLTREEEDLLRRAYEHHRDPYMKRQVWVFHVRGAELERAGHVPTVPAERYPDAVTGGYWPEITR